jgi:hypothetical protein
MLQVLAVLAGIVTAFLSRPVIPVEIAGVASNWGILALGLLASGGSGLWNSVLSYLVSVKDIQKLAVEEKKKALEA